MVGGWYGENQKDVVDCGWTQRSDEDGNVTRLKSKAQLLATFTLSPTFSTPASAAPVGLGTVVAGEAAAVAAVAVVGVDVMAVGAAVGTVEAVAVGVGSAVDVVVTCPVRTAASV